MRDKGTERTERGFCSQFPVFAALGVAVLLAGCQTTKTVSDRHPDPKFDKPVIGKILLVKPDFSVDEYVADKEFCTDRATVHEVESYPAYAPPLYYGGGGLLGAVLAGLIVGVAEGIATGASQSSSHSIENDGEYVVESEIQLSCLQHEQGYDIVGMPVHLEERLEPVKGDDRAQGEVIDEFVKSEAFREYYEWKRVVERDRLDDYRAHLLRYPGGMFANLAERYVQFLEANAQAIAPKRVHLAAETSVFTMFGLSSDGWAAPQNASSGSDTDCSVRQPANVKLLVRNGLAQAMMSFRTGPTISLVGVLHEDGKFDLLGDWPADDPVAISGRLNARFGTTAVFHSVASGRCSNQGSLYEADGPVGQDWLGVPLLDPATLEAVIQGRMGS